MKRFIVKLVLFFLPVMMGLTVIEISLRSIPNIYKYKKEQLLKNADTAGIIVMGSSHAHYGINPDFFSVKGYNFSNISQSLDFDYMLLEKYFDKLDNLEFVVVPVSYSSLFGSLFVSEENWRIKSYNLYYGLRAGFSAKDYFELLNGTVASNIKRIREAGDNKSNPIAVSEKGFGTDFTSGIKNDLVETGKTAALRHTKADWSLFEYNKNYIDKMIKLCEARNVKLIFVTMPAFYTYRDNLNEEQLSISIDYMNSTAKNHDNVYYFNFLDNAQFTEDDYYDADHLNGKGAKKFTLMMDSLINEIRERRIAFPPLF